MRHISVAYSSPPKTEDDLTAPADAGLAMRAAYARHNLLVNLALMATESTRTLRVKGSSSALVGICGAWTIARLTLTEIMRRRFWLAALIVCGLYVGEAFIPIHMGGMRRRMLGPMLDQMTGQIMATFGAEMIEFFCFLFAVALSAGAISAEMERGTLAVVVPKPLPRWSIYVGKLLGINLFLAPLLIVLTSLLQWAIWMHIDRVEPSLWTAMGAMYLYPLLFSSLTLCFSSFTGNLLATILPLIMASTAWSEGILKRLGYIFDVHSLKAAATAVVYVVPLNPMSRWLERALNFDLMQRLNFSNRQFGPSDPPANGIDLCWILGYAAAAFLVGLIVFEKRDL
jgi:ABC-type transport system involved in multi-copper enzyme maturation permease subunit